MRRTVQLARSIWTHPANTGGRARALLRAAAWQVRKRAGPGTWDIPFHGLRLRCFADSPSSSGAVYHAGWPDWWEMQFLARYLRPGDGFIDIGANIGLYSVFAAAHVGPQGRIDAFEPGERSAQRLEAQATLNGLPNLRVHRCAVHAEDGVLQIGWSDNDAMVHVRRACDAQAAAGIPVRAVTLDGMEPYGPYAAGKMDIEGAEPFALAGAARRLAEADPPVWLLELAGYSRLYGVESHEIVARLADAGFDCAVYDASRRELQFTDRPWDLHTQNTLAIARTQRQFVVDRLDPAGAKPGA